MRRFRPRAGIESQLSRARLMSFVMASIGAGCALFPGWDGIVVVELDPVELPASGPEIRIAPIDDERAFRRFSMHPWVPTAKADDRLDPVHTQRVVGRRFSGRKGNRGGELILGDGPAAAELARQALLRGFRTGGWRAISIGPDVRVGREILVRAELLELWVRGRPSLTGYRFEARTRLRLRSGHPGLPPTTIVCGRGVLAAGGRSRAAWEGALRRSLAALASDIEQRLQEPGVEPPSWHCPASHPEATEPPRPVAEPESLPANDR